MILGDAIFLLMVNMMSGLLGIPIAVIGSAISGFINRALGL